jgi:hypothetical protein
MFRPRPSLVSRVAIVGAALAVNVLIGLFIETLTQSPLTQATVAYRVAATAAHTASC